MKWIVLSGIFFLWGCWKSWHPVGRQPSAQPGLKVSVIELTPTALETRAWIWQVGSSWVQFQSAGPKPVKLVDVKSGQPLVLFERHLGWISEIYALQDETQAFEICWNHGCQRMWIQSAVGF